MNSSYLNDLVLVLVNKPCAVPGPMPAPVSPPSNRPAPRSEAPRAIVVPSLDAPRLPSRAARGAGASPPAAPSALLVRRLGTRLPASGSASTAPPRSWRAAITPVPPTRPGFNSESEEVRGKPPDIDPLRAGSEAAERECASEGAAVDRLTSLSAGAMSPRRTADSDTLMPPSRKARSSRSDSSRCSTAALARNALTEARSMLPELDRRMWVWCSPLSQKPGP